jgi:hypothetical protein
MWLWNGIYAAYKFPNAIASKHITYTSYNFAKSITIYEEPFSLSGFFFCTILCIQSSSGVSGEHDQKIALNIH